MSALTADEQLEIAERKVALVRELKAVVSRELDLDDHCTLEVCMLAVAELFRGVISSCPGPELKERLLNIVAKERSEELRLTLH
jgi:hypothetical protein